jgi:hypothetical protein
MTTIYLSPQTWDLCVDASGNIAMASDPYATAQDVASACSIWQGELWYDTQAGIPYLSVLGQPVSLSYIKGQLVAAALTVDGVASAQVFISLIQNRKLTGQVQVTLESGETLTVPV